MIGPKTSLVHERYDSTDDGGGSHTRKWSSKRIIKGILVSIRGDTVVSEGREIVRITHQFWCDYQPGLDISEKDEFSKIGRKDRYRVDYVDNILELGNTIRIDLVKIK